MITLGRWLPELAIMPKGYGVAWVDMRSFRCYCLPVPLNRIAGAFHAWYLEWRRPVENDPLIAAYRKGYGDGQKSGEQYGYDKGLGHAAILFEETRQLMIELRRQPDIRG